MSAAATPEKPKKKPLIQRQVELYKGMAGFGTIGLEIALSIGLMGLLGWWLDKRWDTSPAMLLVGLGLGTIVAIKAIVRVMRLMKKVAEKEEREEGNPAPLFESSTERDQRKARGEPVQDDAVDIVEDTEDRDGSKRRGAAAD